MDISAEAVKALREKTGAGIMECKRAIEDATGDLARAEQLLKERGLAKAAKKMDREANQGIIDSYIHAGGRIGAMEATCMASSRARVRNSSVRATKSVSQLSSTRAPMRPPV